MAKDAGSDDKFSLDRLPIPMLCTEASCSQLLQARSSITNDMNEYKSIGVGSGTIQHVARPNTNAALPIERSRRTEYLQRHSQQSALHSTGKRSWYTSVVFAWRIFSTAWALTSCC